MKNTIFKHAGLVAVEDTAMPKLEQPDDVIIHVVRASVCGSDLWAYRGLNDKPANSANGGHEAIGIVSEVGSAITTVKPGDFVIAPFTHGCGHCAACRAGYDANCKNNADAIFSSGCQAEYVRFQHANWALIKIPGQPSDYKESMLNSFLTLADVMATGYHAARSARVQRGDTVVVVGDGAVGLCAVIAAQLRGAKRIIAMSRHADRQAIAREFGATDIVSERGDEAVAKVMELTDDLGADAVLECVGTELSTDTALKVAAPGAIVGRVGLPHGDADNTVMFYGNVALAGGGASVTTYDKGFLLKAVLEGSINPGKVFTQQFTLDEANAAYQAMTDRKAIKSAIVVQP
ncbi:alcohol dehydrogenase catalytic domain-containing protein [Nicoliella lavandulae]|uniref:Alcohol dehydrogenase catalytic domain-containing protein n=1 Tax=Nicoliella lavandulae TaxID=3082954 RepID=A0ABU8SIV9_9LACO